MAPFLAGCVELPLTWQAKKPPEPMMVRRPKLPITPEEINEANAHDKANALKDELERETNPQPESEAPRPKTDKKR
jgi:hypothetical protein